MSTRDQRILEKMKSLKPEQIQLQNDSQKHAGHAQHLGVNGLTGETHYRLDIVSLLFVGKSRLERQRMVMDLLKDEFVTGLHALEIKAKTPDEN